MTMDPATTAPYLDHFAELRPALPGARLDWLDRLRANAIERFAWHGLPGVKVEEWKYTNLATLAKTRFRAAAPLANSITGAAVARLSLAAPCHRLTFVNGHYRADLSNLEALPDGAIVTGLAAALEAHPNLVEAHLTDPRDLIEERLSGQRDPRPHALVALNAAFMTDGAFIHLRPGVGLDKPVQVLHLAAPRAGSEIIQPRGLIIAEAGARLSVIETFAHHDAGAPDYWSNAVTQVAVGAGADVDHARLQAESASASHIAATHARLDDGARYRSFVMSIGARLSRDEIRADLAGRDGECRLNGVYLGRRDQRMDHWTRVDHRAAGGTTDETYKGVLDDSAHGAFQGKIRVWPGATKSDARQLNHNLLLSNGAEAASKPELEILADDVKCSHGATVGDLDRDALFYLRARGIDQAAAERLLVEAFVSALIDESVPEDTGAYFRAAFATWLGSAVR